MSLPCNRVLAKNRETDIRKENQCRKEKKSRMAFLFCSPLNESNLIYSFKQSKNKTLPGKKENAFTTCLQKKIIPMLTCFWIMQHTKGFKRLPQTWSCKTAQENTILWHLSLERTGSLPYSSFFFSTWNGTTNPDLLYLHIPTCSPFWFWIRRSSFRAYFREVLGALTEWLHNCLPIN